jgi:molybdenum cofactor cytidylyltransferase
MPGQSTIEGVILAAGSSSRAGTFKPALEIGDMSILRRCIDGMYDLCDRIIVVGGHESARLRSMVEGIAKVDCIENPFSERGMFTSVKAGLTQVHGYRCFVLPVDIPLVPPRVYRQLLSVEADVVIPSFHGRNGHPACLSRDILPRILGEPDESSLRDTLRSIGFRTVEVDAEEILLDIDTPEDYRRAQHRFAGLKRT